MLLAMENYCFIFCMCFLNFSITYYVTNTTIHYCLKKCRIEGAFILESEYGLLTFIVVVRMLREELQLLHEQGSYVGEVVKPMDKKKVLVKVGFFL